MAKTTTDIYGISVWRRLAEYTASMAEGGNLDIRAYRALMEHKAIMLKRLQILSEMSFIPNAIEYSDEVAQPASIIYALSLKYNATHKTDILTNISSRIDKICSSEEQILSDWVAKA